jgi:hypothetical protein
LLAELFQNSGALGPGDLDHPGSLLSANRL